MPPDRALRAVARALHAARLRRARSVLVITGKGLGNRAQKPILRQHVEAWLRGPEGARVGVAEVRLEPHGGALLVQMRGAEPIGPADDARRTRPDEEDPRAAEDGHHELHGAFDASAFGEDGGHGDDSGGAGDGGGDGAGSD